ncbi:hydroxyacylglutathione hydrolase [Sphingomonas spermidinifaciens]|uniref:Hydroxyacylglutathione hydrolase n=1 Tax=Sphingomonas spermidinifaciens TaxID=1141889 RepID=A0A2A4B199_9SPHN|nr:hydroxyacylglutathione hydrolase [Sphingomonas spermidinifaciens]PCD01569.1 hydroxyacylglutathione hydrolase [Sphingomonas spermidinifaciens]
MDGPLEIVRVPVLSDNYVWLIHDDESGETVVVDPGEAAPVLAAADARGWRIGQVWNTHWHPDHTAGNQAIKDAHGAVVTAPAAEGVKIPSADRLVAEGDTVTIGRRQARVWETPAHTAGHVSFHFEGEALVFVGDTMFAMGCGRLFEGTAAQMHSALQRLAALPEATTVYCAHEYTLSNAKFAAAVEPDNAAIAERLARVEALRAAGEPTVPTTIGEERATNPFVRAADADELAALRARKDNL